MTARTFTILAVSSDRLVLRRLSKFLEAFGYDVRQAADGEMAVAAALAAPPDFLIFDGTRCQAADLQLVGSIRRIAGAAYVYAFLLAERPDAGDVAAALEAGFDDFLAAPVIYGELLARLRAGARVIEFERRLREQEGLDGLTGLAGKAGLVAEVCRRGQRIGDHPAWLGVIDFDFFHRIAGAHGRDTACQIIQRAADRLGHGLASGEFAAALGGDRLALLFDADEPAAARERCQQAIADVAAEPFVVGDVKYQLTASCGLAPVAAEEAAAAALAGAERALKLAKSSGRNCIVTADEVEREADEWAALAADGNLFASTLARDVMHPCPLLVHAEETLERAHALLLQTGLSEAPVIDSDQRLAGVLSLEQLAARLRGAKSRAPTGAANSVRLVRQVMTTEVTRFDECAPLAELMEYFTDETATLAVIVQDGRPRGMVHCHALAALNQRLTADHFSSASPPTGTSADLLVPDLALAE